MADPSDVPLASYASPFAPQLLRGKVAFISGGGSGIGFRIAEVFARHGCAVILASRSLARVQEAASRIVAVSTAGSQPMALQLDVRDAAACAAAMTKAVAALGPVDILVNSAAGNFLSPAAAMSASGFKVVVDIDLLGTFNTIKAWFDASASTRGGVCLSITMARQIRGQVLQAHAGAAKAAIEALTRHLAVEWGPLGIRLNCLAPGPIADTEGFRRLGGGAPAEVLARATRQIPLQRMGTRTDIAESALFLVSDAAAYVTGTTLIADGGAWMTEDNGAELLFGDQQPGSKL